MSDTIRFKVVSSALAEIGYDEDRQILEVKHHPNKAGIASVYQYIGVPNSLWDELNDEARRAEQGDPEASVGRMMARIRKTLGVTSVKIEETYEQPDALVAQGGSA